VFLSSVDAPAGVGFAAGCRAAFQTLGERLQRQGAALGDTVKVTAYLADMRWTPDYRTCLDAVFGKGPRPAIATVGVTRPMARGSRLTLEATAATPLP
jgi:enamine deaminase RidA (YjgF/YER057c/UK114 family)